MKRILMFLLVALLGLLLVVPVVFAGSKTITFQWDYPTPPADLAGFYIYKANAAGGPYPTTARIATIPFVAGTTTYTSLQPFTAPDNAETTYYFVASAYDTSGNESGKSNEISYKFDFLSPINPINFIIKVVTSP